jgi:hypothetical protein
VVPVLIGLWTSISAFRATVVWLVGPPFVILLLAAGLAEQNLRFVLPALPFIAILAGVGTVVLVGHLGHSLRYPAYGAVGLVVLAVAAAGLFDMHKVVSASDKDRATSSWAASSIPRGSALIAFELTETVSHSTSLRPRDLSTVSIHGVRSLADRRRTFLLVRVSSMTHQWRLRPEGAILRALQRSPGLQVVGSDNGYTLFRVRRS